MDWRLPSKSEGVRTLKDRKWWWSDDGILEVQILEVAHYWG